MTSRVLTFNVGGTRFETTERTILKHPDSMLAAMISQRWDPSSTSMTAAAAASDGASSSSSSSSSQVYFVDRSPKYFELILDYMRTDELPALPPGVGQRNLISEARYFMIERLIHDLEHLQFRPTRFELYQMMQSKDLSNVDLSNMKLQGKNFAGFNLDHANLSGSDLSEADLTMCSLRGADLTDSCLECATLRGADFTEACLLRSDMSRSILSHSTKFRNANINNIVITGAQGINEADWTSPAV